MTIKIQNKLINFYGNPAGFIKDNTAIVDSMFEQDELTAYLSSKGFDTEFKKGVFERLSLNRHYYESEDATPLKKVRIWQLRQGFDVECRFAPYEAMVSRHGEPSEDNYKVVFDGELQTNDLEEIYQICNLNHPKGYTGHSLSMSDVIELYDDSSSEFHYVDRFGFKEIDFAQAEQTQGMEMGMQSL